MGLRVQVDVHPGTGHVVVTATGQADPAAAGSLAAVVDVLARAPVRSVVLDLDQAEAGGPAVAALVDAIEARGVAERVALTVRGRHPGLGHRRWRSRAVTGAHEHAVAEPLPAT